MVGCSYFASGQVMWIFGPSVTNRGVTVHSPDRYLPQMHYGVETTIAGSVDKTEVDNTFHSALPDEGRSEAVTTASTLFRDDRIEEEIHVRNRRGWNVCQFRC